MCLTKACGAGIAGPADVLGNHNQDIKVGNQVPGNPWHCTEWRTGPSQTLSHRTRWVQGTGQVRHIVNIAVKLRHSPPRCKPTLAGMLRNLLSGFLSVGLQNVLKPPTERKQRATSSSGFGSELRPARQCQLEPFN